MTTAAINDALKSMTRKELEELSAKVERELMCCMVCGNEGARTIRAYDVSRGIYVTLLICLPCFEKHRLPPSRSK